ncbi:Reticulocyte-binding protein 2-like protein a [Penicillium digitatum]|nr:Reticulocyte-binding protein 2-like protein a [Penicillium digitatum]
MSGFHWNTTDFPKPIFGSHESWSLNKSLCADRYSRYGAYGYLHDWQQVDWAHLQHECLQRNSDRYRRQQSEGKITALYKSLNFNVQSREPLNKTDRAHPRAAVILRSWIGIKYTENDLYHIRSMIMEPSLYSGAEYELILLSDCQGEKMPKETDHAAWETFKAKLLPQELRSLAAWFNADIGILQYFQPTQIFSRLHPQYDYIWQFEIDSRYTGHMYERLHKATEFAKQRPRKYLWERNSHFYIPAVHGIWEEFMKKIDQEMPGHDNSSVWGPHPAEGIDIEGQAILPPVPRPGDEPGTWGVSEEADLITWLPHFNPVGTDGPFRGRVFNFPQDQETPRRAAVVAMSCISARLLSTLLKNRVKSGIGLASEMSPISWALYYGLKAVQVPQPVYHNSKWDPEELNRRVNPGEPGKVNAGLGSIWSWGQHDDIIYNTTFMFNSEFAEKLYRAWLGYDGAEEWDKC